MENERDGLWLRLVGRRGLAPQVGEEGVGKVSGKVSLWLQGRHKGAPYRSQNTGRFGGTVLDTKSSTCLCANRQKCQWRATSNALVLL